MSDNEIANVLKDLAANHATLGREVSVYSEAIRAIHSLQVTIEGITRDADGEIARLEAIIAKN